MTSVVCVTVPLYVETVCVTVPLYVETKSVTGFVSVQLLYLFFGRVALYGKKFYTGNRSLQFRLQQALSCFYTEKDQDRHRNNEGQFLVQV